MAQSQLNSSERLNAIFNQNAIRVLVVVPVYNHAAAITAVVDGIRSSKIPCLLVDDKSDIECRTVLERLKKDGVDLINLDKNGGKGHATISGFEYAWHRGFTHVLQIDADGQHDTGDISKFLDEAHAYPDALICGLPIFDTDAPFSRRYGRWLTHVWVWINTLSFSMGDAMCGFRLYPLEKTISQIRKNNIEQGMGFDIDIAVRLMWDKVPVKNIKTRVNYPMDGTSHFRMFRDNFLISKLHAKLFFTMVYRFMSEKIIQKYRYVFNFTGK